MRTEQKITLTIELTHSDEHTNAVIQYATNTVTFDSIGALLRALGVEVAPEACTCDSNTIQMTPFLLDNLPGNVKTVTVNDDVDTPMGVGVVSAINLDQDQNKQVTVNLQGVYETARLPVDKVNPIVKIETIIAEEVMEHMANNPNMQLRSAMALVGHKYDKMLSEVAKAVDAYARSDSYLFTRSPSQNNAMKSRNLAKRRMSDPSKVTEPPVSLVNNQGDNPLKSPPPPELAKMLKYAGIKQ